jgi:hypothetical protein
MKSKNPAIAWAKAAQSFGLPVDWDAVMEAVDHCATLVPAINDVSWPPTSKEINLLPPNLRRYIHDLHTDADPAGTIRENQLVKAENEQLRKLLEIMTTLEQAHEIS